MLQEKLILCLHKLLNIYFCPQQPRKQQCYDILQYMYKHNRNTYPQGSELLQTTTELW